MKGPRGIRSGVTCTQSDHAMGSSGNASRIVVSSNDREPGIFRGHPVCPNVPQTFFTAYIWKDASDEDTISLENHRCVDVTFLKLWDTIPQPSERAQAKLVFLLLVHYYIQKP